MELAVGIGLSVMGVILGFVWLINNKSNNRVIKEISTETQKVIDEMRKETLEILKIMDERTVKMDERTAKISEQINKMDEHIGIIPLRTVQLSREEKQ
ncbi:MAG: hypothetical protein AB1349_07320 [Elusimicrobiota bacterium]